MSALSSFSNPNQMSTTPPGVGIDEGRYCRAWLDKGFCPMQYLGSEEIEVGSRDRVHSHERCNDVDIKSISSSSGDADDDSRSCRCIFKHEYPSTFSEEDISRHKQLLGVMNEIFDVPPQDMIVELADDPANSTLIQIHMESLINHISSRRAAAAAAAASPRMRKEKRDRERREAMDGGRDEELDIAVRDFNPYNASLDSLKKALDLLVHRTLEGTNAIKKQKTETKMRCIGSWNNNQQNIQPLTPNNSTASLGESINAGGGLLSGHDVEQAFFSQRLSSLRDPSLAIPTAPTVEQLPHLSMPMPMPMPMPLAGHGAAGGGGLRRARFSSAISVVSSDSADDEAGSATSSLSEGT